MTTGTRCSCHQTATVFQSTPSFHSQYSTSEDSRAANGVYSSGSRRGRSPTADGVCCWCGQIRARRPSGALQQQQQQSPDVVSPLRVNANAAPWWTRPRLLPARVRESLVALLGELPPNKRLFFIGPYLVGRVIGRGAFSKVRLGFRYDPKSSEWRRVALKIIFRTCLERSRHPYVTENNTHIITCWDQALHELCLTHSVFGSNRLPRLHEVLADGKHGLWVAVLEFAGSPVMYFHSKLEVFSIEKRRPRQAVTVYAESAAVALTRGLLQCLTELHGDCDTVHKDVKPSNVLRLRDAAALPSLASRQLPLSEVALPKFLPSTASTRPPRSKLLDPLRFGLLNNATPVLEKESSLPWQPASDAVTTGPDTTRSQALESCGSSYDDDSDSQTSSPSESDALSAKSDCTEDFIWTAEEGMINETAAGPPQPRFLCLCCAAAAGRADDPEPATSASGTATADDEWPVAWECSCCGLRGTCRPLTREPPPEVTLIDLNSAVQSRQPDLPIHDAEGTRWFTPPECFALGMSNTRNGRLRDAWSVGCLVYALLLGRPPFRSASEAPIASIFAIQSDELEWPPSAQLSSKAKNFISGLLEKDPAKRLTVEGALGHPWLQMP